MRRLARAAAHLPPGTEIGIVQRDGSTWFVRIPGASEGQGPAVTDDREHGDGGADADVVALGAPPTARPGAVSVLPLIGRERRWSCSRNLRERVPPEVSGVLGTGTGVVVLGI
jgi:hypothetical protein